MRRSRSAPNLRGSGLPLKFLVLQCCRAPRRHKPPHPTPEEAPPAFDGTAALDARITGLRREVTALEEQMAAPGVSRSTLSGVQHKLRMKRGEVSKLEREIRKASAVEEHE